MRLTDFALLTDENIDPEVETYLRSHGFDVLDVCEQRWQGSDDEFVLSTAHAENRVVVTHDADFGRLATVERREFTGILYLRPGHIDPQFTIDTIQTVLAAEIDLSQPFIFIAKRAGDSVSLRVRWLEG